MLKQILTESINDKGLFKCVFMAGIPGAGKTTTTQRIVDGTIQPRIVNTDKFFEYYLFNDDSLDLDILDKSKILTKRQLFFYVNGMLPLLVDTTSSSVINIIRRKAMLESIGYDVGMVWIDTDVEIALERNRARNRQVDEDFIHRADESIRKNVTYLRSHFQFFKRMENNQEIMDNSVVLDAYKTVRKFYYSPLVNPIGQRTLETMREEGYMYLTPNIYTPQELADDLGIWYRRKT